MSVEETTSPFTFLQNEKYISLKTFRKSGVAVPSPVWFALDPADKRRMYVVTDLKSGKVKRLRNNEQVLLTACDQRGRVHGEEIEARGHLLPQNEYAHANLILAKRFGFMYKVFQLLGKITRSERTFLVIEAV